jgi:hypothetical protein
MQPLSAIDAIQPAWDHTRALLFTRRRDWRLLLKVGLVAVFAQIGGCNANFKSPGDSSLPHGMNLHALAAILIVGGVLVLVLGLVFFYVSSRLQFVLFEMVLRRETTVSPLWRRYGPVTWRWIGLKMLFFVTALLCLAPIVTPFVILLIRAMPADGQEPHNFGAFLAAIVGFVLVILFLLLVCTAAYLLVLDFGLPSIALEDTGIAVTFRRVWSLFRTQPGATLFYVLMRLLLQSAGTLVTYLALLVGTLVLMIPLGALALLLWLALRHAGAAGHVAMVAGWAVLGLILVAALFVAGVMLLGVVFTFVQAYALYFLAGRYPLLDSLLVRNRPAAGMPPPAGPTVMPGFAQ